MKSDELNKNNPDPFESWWKEVGSESAYPMDQFRARELARLAWIASRVEISKFIIHQRPSDFE